MPTPARFLAALTLASALIAHADTPPATAPAAQIPLSPEATAILTTLQNRKATLTDFTANVVYYVDNIAGDRDGKLGTVDYLNTPAGPSFSVDFTTTTFGGKPTHKAKSQIICDPANITIIDFDTKQFDQSPTPPGNSLDSPIPLPIGVPVKDVTDNFNVAILPPPTPTAKAPADPNLITLRLTPLLKGKFEYSQLDVTVDKKLELPIKIIVTNPRNGDITTLQFNTPDINTGKAKLLPTTPPGTTAQGWTINIKPATPATTPAK